MSKIAKSIAVLGVVAGLGVAALPLSSYAATPANVDREVTVQLTIEEELNFKIDSAEAGKTVTLTNTSPTGLYTQATPLVLTVDTTVAKGYTLNMVGATDETSTTNNVLKNTTGSSSATIPSATFSGTNATSAWGYKIAEGATTVSGTDFTTVPTTATKVASSDEATKEDSAVIFGAYVVAGQEAGTYEGKVKFTASANTGD